MKTMKDKKLRTPEPPNNIAADFFIGNSHIQIADDFCSKTTEGEVEKIIERICERALPRLPLTVFEVAAKKE